MFILVYHNIIVSSNDCKKVFFVVKYLSKETRIFFLREKPIKLCILLSLLSVRLERIRA